jgi:hypothetical protein
LTPAVDWLIARVAELEAERHVTNEALDDAVQELRSRSADRLTALLAPSQVLREPDVSVVEGESAVRIDITPAAKCRCDEPDADPYACEADDCTGEFSELNPFGGGPVQGHDAKVSRTCGCGWRTSVWHVNDGSAEEELHGHVTRVHGGTYPAEAGGQ